MTTPSLPGEPDDAREEAQQALDDLYTKPRQDEAGQTAYAAVPPPLPSAPQPPPESPRDSPQPPPAQSPGMPSYPQSSPQQPAYSTGAYGPPPGQGGVQFGGQPGAPGYPPPPPPGQFGPGYGYGQPMPGAPGMSGMPAGMPPFAGWWQRAGAWLLDNFLVGVALGLIVNWSHSGALDALTGVITFGWAIYNAYLGGKTGQSYGKRAVGIRLARLADGKPLGGGSGVLRWFLNYVLFFWIGAVFCLIPALLNYLWPLWDGKCQTWGDKIVESVVVRA